MKICTKNVINENMTILENFRKKNHQIWIKYDGEKLDTKFNYRLKEEMRTMIPIELFSHCHLVDRLRT
jgi:hypothetical protein